MSNVSIYAEAKQFAIEAGTSLVSYTIDGFFKVIHERFYKDVDISFMDYFLEIVDKEFEFVVPHSKLVEFGVMSSKQSKHVEGKLKSLDLEEGEHYRLTDIREPVAQGGNSLKKVYMLTPEAFKLALIRARSYTGQAVNPLVYGMYYILLEKIFKLYILYGKAHDAKMSAVLLRDVSKDRDDALEARKQADADRKQSVIREKRAEEQRNEANRVAKELLDITKHLKADNDELKRDNKITHAKLQEQIDDNKITHARLDVTNEKLEEKTKSEEKLAKSNIVLAKSNDRLTQSNDVLAMTNDRLNQTIANATKKLADQKILSTMKPLDYTKNHYAAMIARYTRDRIEVQIISRQQTAFRNRLRQMINDGFEVVIPEFYIANGIDYRNNVATYATALLKNVMAEDRELAQDIMDSGLKIGKQKSEIPHGSAFTIEMLVKCAKDVLTDTQEKSRFYSLTN